MSVQLQNSFAEVSRIESDLERARRYPQCIPELGQRLKESGKIYYSHPRTLRKGPLLLMGHNPGGREGGSIAQTLTDLHLKKGSDFVHEDWLGRGDGRERLQRRVVALCGFLAVDIECVFATNLIFFRSRDVGSSEFSSNKEVCWRLHEHFISEVVDPDLILVFGNSGDSPFTFLAERFGKHASIQEFAAHHGSWNARSFEAEMLGRNRRVFGLPHLSRYSPKFDSPALLQLKQYVAHLRKNRSYLTSTS